MLQGKLPSPEKHVTHSQASGLCLASLDFQVIGLERGKEKILGVEALPGLLNRFLKAYMGVPVYVCMYVCMYVCTSVCMSFHIPATLCTHTRTTLD